MTNNNTKTTTEKKALTFDKYLQSNNDGQLCSLMNTKLIVREVDYFKSKENKDKDGLIQKVGANDESYKMIIRSIKYNCSDCSEDFLFEIEGYFVNKLVEELVKIGAWKKASIKFQDKTLIGLDFIQFRNLQVEKGRLKVDEEYKAETGKERFIAIDADGNRHYPSSINWTNLDKPIIEKDVTEKK